MFSKTANIISLKIFIIISQMQTEVVDAFGNKNMTLPNSAIVSQHFFNLV